jgi:hypothetical protein
MKKTKFCIEDVNALYTFTCELGISKQKRTFYLELKCLLSQEISSQNA